MTESRVGPSRRTFVRAAAWTVPVVSVAAAAPAFAASPQGTTSFTAAGSAVKWSNGSEKHVSWDLVLANGAIPITSVSIVFTYAPNSGSQNFTQFEIYSYLPKENPTGWSTNFSPPASTVTVNYGPIAANKTLNIHTDFAGGDNAAGTVAGTATIQYANGTSRQVTLGPVEWISGSKHVHPA